MRLVGMQLGDLVKPGCGQRRSGSGRCNCAMRAGSHSYPPASRVLPELDAGSKQADLDSDFDSDSLYQNDFLVILSVLTPN